MPPRSNREKSPDYALYEKMRRRSPRASRYWMIGDRLYHAGLLLTMISIPAIFFAYTRSGSGGITVWAAVLLLGSVGILALGIYFKRESYKLAMKAGIDIGHSRAENQLQ